MTKFNKEKFMKKGFLRYDKNGDFSMGTTLGRIRTATLYLNEEQIKVLASVMSHIVRDTVQAEDIRLAANIDARSVVIEHYSIECAAEELGIDPDIVNKDEIVEEAAVKFHDSLHELLKDLLRRKKYEQKRNL